MLGEEDEAPVFPVFPVFPLSPLSPVFPLLPVEPVEGVLAAPPLDPPEVVVLAALFPGCSCATTMPMPTVAPVVAKRAARVRLRRRARARSLLAPALGSFWADMFLEDLCSGAGP
jgi:hypothetical protein